MELKLWWGLKKAPGNGSHRLQRFLQFLVFGGFLAVAGCAPTQVQTVSANQARMPKPDRILIYNFAVSPDEVQLDTGIDPATVALAKRPPRTAEELQVGHAVADALAVAMVNEIGAFGIPAERASGLPTGGETVVIIKGQLVSIDEGNRAERVVIGLGRGRSTVKANVQAYQLTPEGMRKLESMRAEAQSSFKPGMAEMMGVGGVAGHLVISTVVSGVVGASTEMLGATVEDDGRRLANSVANNLRAYFVNQGWIPAAPPSQ